MNDHPAAISPETPIHRDVNYRWHRVGKVIDDKSGGMRSNRAFTNPENRDHDVFEALAGIVTHPVDSAVYSLEVPGTNVMGQVSTVDANFLGLASGEVADLSVGEGVKTIKDPKLWHECHSNYDIRVMPVFRIP
ncbi:MAG: hypothetical protein WD156_03860 [Acidimicrobiia bacterium]